MTAGSKACKGKHLLSAPELGLWRVRVSERKIELTIINMSVTIQVLWQSVISKKMLKSLARLPSIAIFHFGRRALKLMSYFCILRSVTAIFCCFQLLTPGKTCSDTVVRPPLHAQSATTPRRGEHEGLFLCNQGGGTYSSQKRQYPSGEVPCTPYVNVNTVVKQVDHICSKI